METKGDTIIIERILKSAGTIAVVGFDAVMDKCILKERARRASGRGSR